MNKNGFTLIEIMIGILVSSIILIIGFQAVSSVLVGKVKLIEETNIEKESFSFMQKFFEEIKAGGLIDYEEYFNRKVVGNNSYSSGHFDKKTGFGNFGVNGVLGTNNYGDGFYYCRSGNGIKMSGTGCINNFNTTQGNVSSKPQRYGQYSFQFIDYNSNYDEDLGDEDGKNGIIGDDDDEYLGVGPKVFDLSKNIKELYLIGANKKSRTLFRWTVKQDPYIDNPNYVCNSSDGINFTGSGCLGTIEFLKLEGKDWGLDHDILNSDKTGQYDGVIDTWLIDKDFSSIKGKTNRVVAGSDNENYRLSLFPESINVKSFDIRAYPDQNLKDAWKQTGIDISPYVRLNMVLTPSFKVKRKIKGKIPEFNLSTTINLTDMFSK